MGKKKSSLSRALQNAQEQKQRAQKEEAKKLNQQQKQPKHLNNSNANKPNAQRPVPVARVQQKSRPTTDTHSHDAHHEKKYLDCEPTTTQRNDIELPEASCQTTAPDVDIGSHSIGHSVDQHKSHTKPRLSMVNKNDQVLLVGEGNFSFTVSLLVEYSHPGDLITASTIDTKETVLKKYPDSEAILEFLEEKKVRVLFELDGCKLNQDKRIKKLKIQFDKVIFNFPHVGGSEPDQDRKIRANQILILRFFRSVSTLLFQPDGWTLGQDLDRNKKRPKSATKTGKKLKSHARRPSASCDSDDLDHLESGQELDPEMDLPVRKPGSVLITAGTCPPYSFWDVPALAKNGNILAHKILYPAHPNLKQKGEQPVYKLIRSFHFDKSINTDGSHTYQHRQTNGFKSSQKDTRPVNPRTWEFELSSL
ncbi:hypothetical protein PCANC_06543 [Puccinia coronata f. sp. avenae]|uniref:25S rRNA (uridine-N(3))-methyltransferase BMT5-like domain-containing protein n=1 Tax=Puccinia coronata f. sp. avenae TaxID=200324 RepID=A0A2N5VAW9_9BASI|nr:hypothetical protein PCANC_06543 [Puccinia coronata f. sp. avenae]PLW47157.1 hypothetical protein PCASD_02336 [Puccinia coronata f. sp. avenae]